MLTVGLTGGIGAGKSAVTSRLAAHGATVVDADLLAREVVEPGTPGLAAVVECFGPEVLAPDGRLDRAGLGRRVFADPGALARLNTILHPLIGERTVAAFAAAREARVDVLVHDVALLVENGLAPAYDLVVVVDAGPATQLRRLTEQRGLTPEEAADRLARQASRSQRLAVADEVIRNEGTLTDLDREVAALWDRLITRARG